MAKAIEKAGKEATTAEKRLTKMEKAAEAIKKANDPQKRYNAQIEKTARLAAKGKLSIDDAQRAAVRYGRSLDRAGKSGKGAFRGVGDQLKGTLAGILSVTGAIGLLRAELEAIKQESEKTTQAQLTVAQAQQNLRQNTFSFPQQQANALEKGLFDIAARRGLPAAQVLAAGTANISGTSDTALTEKLVGITTQFTRDPAALAAIAGGLGDISSTSGIKDPKELLGFLTLVQANARVESAASVGTEVGKVLSSFTGELVGSDAPTGAAIFAALTKGIADKSGQLSRTAAVNLIDRSSKFFQGEGGKGIKEEDRDEFNEQLALLFDDRELGEKFVKGASFRAASKGGIAKLILGDPTVKGAFLKAREQLGSKESLLSFSDEALSRVNAGDLQRTARTEGTIESAAEKFRLSKNANLTTESSDNLIALLAAADNGTLTGKRIASFMRAGSNFSSEEATEEINASLAALRGQRTAKELFGDSFGPTQGQEDAATSLIQIRDVLIENSNRQPITTRAE